MWTLESSMGHESAKIAHLVVAYAQGMGLDLGVGTMKCWPSMIGIDSLKDYGGQRPPAVDIVCDAEKIDVIGDKTLDYIFSSHFLEHVVDHKACLREWWGKLKVGGNLILYLPHANFYPKIGEAGGNPDHKHDFLPDDIINVMKEIGSWDLLENEERSKTNEYSFLQVFHKQHTKGSKHKHNFKVWERNPEGKKRCLVIRYGAIGDMLQVSSILPELKKQGYHITFNTADNGYEVLKNDPYIDEWIVQAKDYVPNQELGPYWQQLKFEGRYDKIINLCESIEGALLTLPGRLQHEYSDESRRKLLNVNYLERTHDIAGVPYEFAPKFYPDIAEMNWARKERAKYDVPVIAWAISGSAQHKIYPWVQIVCAWLLENTPAHIFILGDESTKPLQKGIVDALDKDGIDHSRMHQMCGVWKIRETLAFIQQVDCMVGPETGLLNAICMEKNAKVIYLSHSSHENLTRYWKNTTVLEPDKGKCSCFPCHRLHYTLEYCPQDEKTQGSLCTSSIAPKRVFEAIMAALHYKKVIKSYEQEPDPTAPSGGTNVVRRAA